MDSGDDRYSTDGVGRYWTLIPGPASALIDTKTKKPARQQPSGVLWSMSF